MPFQINNKELDQQLTKHANQQPVPSTNGRLAIAIVRAVLDLADAQNKDAGKVIGELKENTQRLHAKAA